jgi:hypothetical protein
MSHLTIKEISEAFGDLENDLQDIVYGSRALDDLLGEIAQGKIAGQQRLCMAAHFMSQRISSLARDLLNKYIEVANATYVASKELQL